MSGRNSGVPLSSFNAKMQEQIAAQLHPVKAGSPLVMPAVEKDRLRQNKKGPNKTEAEFGLYLACDHPTASIEYEGVTLRLGNGVRFTPDWFVHFKSLKARPLIYEVKGFMESDAAVKLKVAASQHRWADFYLVSKRKKAAGGGWQIQEILP